MPEQESRMGLEGDSAAFEVFSEIDFIAHLAENEFRRVLSDGLTTAQFGVLNRLMRLGANETIGELAAAFQVSQPTMSSTVKRLLEKRFVDLVPDTEDRRVKRVRVITRGRSARRQSVKKLEAVMKNLGEEAPDIDWERLLPALSEIRNFLDKRRG